MKPSNPTPPEELHAFNDTESCPVKKRYEQRLYETSRDILVALIRNADHKTDESQIDHIKAARRIANHFLCTHDDEWNCE